MYTNAFCELSQNFTKIHQMTPHAVLRNGDNRGQTPTGDSPRLEGM